MLRSRDSVDHLPADGDPDEYADTDDSALIGRLRAGDPKCFEHLVRVHGPSLIRYAARFLGSVERAREAVQDVYLRLWNDRDNLQITRDVTAYLFWLTRNHATHILQSDQATHRREQRWSAETAGHAETVSVPPAVSIEAEETRGAIVSALQGVPPRCREIFLMVWDEQCSYAEVADILGISVATVRNQMSRAVRHLAKTLQHPRV